MTAVINQIHLDGFNDIFNEKDRLEFGEYAVEFVEESIRDLGNFVGGKSDINVQKLLKREKNILETLFNPLIMSQIRFW